MTDHQNEKNPACLKIVILADKDPAQLRRSIQQGGILESGGPVLLRSQHVHTASPESCGDRLADVHIHVQRNAHGSLPKARSRCHPGESSAQA